MRSLSGLKQLIPTILILVTIGLFSASCSTNPATGDRQFTAFMSEESENNVGQKEHAKIIKAFGVSNDPKLNTMVNRIGQKMVPHTERENVNYTFTILDSPIINAFALPGGFVYVSRGLVALANDEAELAAVIAHEIGHITARHSAERYSQTIVAGLGVGLVSVLLESKEVGDILGAGAGLYLRSYSRDQEHQADTLGIRYSSRANYDPMGMSRFLASLESSKKLMMAEAGQSDETPSYLSTHPVTADRVSKTRQEAAGVTVPSGQPIVGRRQYLSTINNMLYGDSEKSGFIDDGHFVHPQIGFIFRVPDKFHLINQPDSIVMKDRNSDVISIMDFGKLDGAGSVENYVRNVWLADKSILYASPTKVNGMNAFVADYQGRVAGKASMIRVFAIQWKGDTLVRFQTSYPSNKSDYADDNLKRTIYSFRRLGASEASRYKPKRLIVVEASGNQSVRSISAKMPYTDGLNEKRFRVLNALGPTEELKKGDLYKMIVQ